MQPEGQILKLGPNFLSVEADGIFLSNALCDEEAGVNQADHKTAQEPAQELGQDLGAVRELAGWTPACEEGKISQFKPKRHREALTDNATNYTDLLC